ncbi:DUF4041 domain-containing protein [Spartinivicinus ruber]|uniref:DUF4041 domain-containing protein n=1 Tax=Spartinivicinus ruber TaxID=2683272 RepID=UPI0013D2EDDA|nr:DUF4041 domain-containing protein [Spartinivicinus ruber]
MEYQPLIWLIILFIITILITDYLARRKASKQLYEFRSLSKAVKHMNEELTNKNTKLETLKQEFKKINNETLELQELKKNSEKIKQQLLEVSHNLSEKKSILSSVGSKLHNFMSSIDLYSRVEEFIDAGFFEEPEYLYETSDRYSEQIRRVREQQKELIKNKKVIFYPDHVKISLLQGIDKKIFDGQIKLMLRAFNIECDFLIGKVNPGNFSRTLERIEKLANNIEKSTSHLFCAFNINYVKLKYEECKLQYQFMLKKQKEQEEQRLIKEQIREEQKAAKEYERAIAEAEKEEQLYRELLIKARKELEDTSQESRIIAEQRIIELERQLAEAEAKEERAKSLAEQTRRGHVYVISNIGSFGKNVYKIGLTRRLDPLDRVKELGGASVPFSFDVHAMIFSDDAPALETALHREFTQFRVNAVNQKKEFFYIDLNTIKKAAENISGSEVEFKMTALAEEYYESRRLQSTPKAA